MHVNRKRLLASLAANYMSSTGSASAYTFTVTWSAVP